MYYTHVKDIHGHTRCLKQRGKRKLLINNLLDSQAIVHFGSTSTGVYKFMVIICGIFFLLLFVMNSFKRRYRIWGEIFTPCTINVWSFRASVWLPGLTIAFHSQSGTSFDGIALNERMCIMKEERQQLPH